MFRLWGKIFKDNRMLRDTVICNDSNDTRTHKIFHALDEICHEFDLSKPIWLDSTIAEFKKHDKTRFYQDNFVDSIDFDYLEIHIIEEYNKGMHSLPLNYLLTSYVLILLLQYFLHGLRYAPNIQAYLKRQFLPLYYILVL